MSCYVDTWFLETIEGVESSLHRRYDLAAPIGPVLLLDSLSTEYDISRLNSVFVPAVNHDGADVCYSYRIIVTNDAPELQSWHSELSLAGAQRNDNLGRGAFPVRWWPPRGERQTWVAEYLNTGHVVMRQGHTILLALKRGISEYRYLQRVLRELFIHGGLTYNLLLMHAAVISINNAGILIMGAEGAGKTDLSLKLCRLAGGEVISVDRCLAGLDGNDLNAWELPFGLNIYYRTLVDLGCDLRAVEEAAQPLGNEFYLDIPDFVRLCSLNVRASTRIEKCIWLTPKSDAEMASPGTRDRDQLYEALRSMVLNGKDEGYLADWLGLGPASPLDIGQTVQTWPLDRLAEGAINVTYSPANMDSSVEIMDRLFG